MIEDGTPAVTEEGRGTRPSVYGRAGIFLLLARHELDFDTDVPSLAAAKVQ